MRSLRAGLKEEINLYNAVNGVKNTTRTAFIFPTTLGKTSLLRHHPSNLQYCTWQGPPLQDIPIQVILTILTSC